MEVERVVGKDDQIELWLCRRSPEIKSGSKPFRKFMGFEQPLHPTYSNQADVHEIICWSRSSTLGTAPIFNPDIIRRLPSNHGIDTLGCDIVEAGKMRNGARRWWCRTHQKHWGTKKDIETAWNEGSIRCANHAQLLSYVVDPQKLRLEDFANLQVSCSFPPALTNAGELVPKSPAIYVQANGKSNKDINIDGPFDAVTLIHAQSRDLFDIAHSDEIHVTPPSAMEFALALENKLPTGCVNCRHCGCPHQDLGEFGQEAHVKHLCSNCGRDSIWTPLPIVSTPLSTLRDQFDLGFGFEESTGSINLDEYLGASFTVWPSMPAILWSHDRPQKRGIRVQLSIEGEKVLNDTFGEVTLNGKRLERAKLIEIMLSNTLP